MAGLATITGRPSVVAASETAATAPASGVPALSRPCAQTSDAFPCAATPKTFNALLNARSSCVPTRLATIG